MQLGEAMEGGSIVQTLPNLPKSQEVSTLLLHSTVLIQYKDLIGEGLNPGMGGIVYKLS